MLCFYYSADTDIDKDGFADLVERCNHPNGSGSCNCAGNECECRVPPDAA